MRITHLAIAGLLFAACATGSAVRRGDDDLQKRAVAALRQWIQENPQAAVNLGDYDLDHAVVETALTGDCRGGVRQVDLVRFPRYDGAGWAFASFYGGEGPRDAAGFMLGDEVKVRAMATEPICE